MRASVYPKRAGHGQREVADGGQASTPRDCRTLNSGDGGLGQFIQSAEEFCDSLRVGAVIGGGLIIHALQDCQVEAGTECVARALEHDNATTSGGGFFKGGYQLQLHLRSHRVAAFRTIERDRPD